MLTGTEIKTVVEQEIREILLEDQDELLDELPEITDTTELWAMGLNSLMLARLIIRLGERLRLDPFSDETAVIADARTVDQLVTVYERAQPASEGRRV
jgi:acyl carrier protein